MARLRGGEHRSVFIKQGLTIHHDGIDGPLLARPGEGEPDEPIACFLNLGGLEGELRGGGVKAETVALRRLVSRRIPRTEAVAVLALFEAEGVGGNPGIRQLDKLAIHPEFVALNRLVGPPAEGDGGPAFLAPGNGRGGQGELGGGHILLRRCHGGFGKQVIDDDVGTVVAGNHGHDGLHVRRAPVVAGEVADDGGIRRACGSKQGQVHLREVAAGNGHAAGSHVVLTGSVQHQFTLSVTAAEAHLSAHTLNR